MTDKAAIYRRTENEIRSVLENEDNLIAQMATISCLLAHAFPGNIWTGFYMVDPKKPRELIVGPYQGTLGCMRIPFDQGVCGAAARTGMTQVVANVDDFPGHIACDSRSVSEIVVPVRGADGEVVAVLDIDNPSPNSFDETDRQALEKLVSSVFANS